MLHYTMLQGLFFLMSGTTEEKMIGNDEFFSLSITSQSVSHRQALLLLSLW